MKNLVCEQCVHRAICKHTDEFDKVIDANMEVNTDKSRFYMLYAYCKFFESSTPSTQNVSSIIQPILDKDFYSFARDCFFENS